MKHSNLITLLFLSAISVPAMGNGFTGVWTVNTYCLDNGKACGDASFRLIQTGSRVCGDHTGNTPNAGRMNEGFPGSVRGTVVGGTAALVVTSGRNSSIVLGKASLTKRDLRWQILEQITPGEPQGDDLIYGGGVLKYVGAKVSDELRNACK